MLKRLIKPLIPKKILTTLTWNTQNTAQESPYWWNFQEVREIVLKGITGDPALSWYTDQIRKRVTQFGRTLAFGDGHGMAAEAALTRHDTSEMIYFNISKGEGKRFLKSFKEYAFNFPYHFVKAG